MASLPGHAAAQSLSLHGYAAPWSLSLVMQPHDHFSYSHAPPFPGHAVLFQAPFQAVHISIHTVKSYISRMITHTRVPYHLHTWMFTMLTKGK